MIPKDGELQLAAQMRATIQKALGEINDAPSDLFASGDSSPNWLTKKGLKSLLEVYGDGLVALGAKRIFFHGDCGSRNHQKIPKNTPFIEQSKNSYWRWALADGRRDKDFAGNINNLIDGTAMETSMSVPTFLQSYKKVICPCSPKTVPQTEHRVSPYFIWPKDSQSRIGQLATLTDSLYDAIECSEDKKPRSAIREKLLEALIRLDEIIVDETAKELISRRGF